jgi:hypothetical protein
VRELAWKPLKAAAPKLFLGYVRKDLQRVEPIYEALKAAGLNPWMDVRDIAAGQRWRARITDEIDAADFFIPFISRNTLNKSGFIWTEIKMACRVWERRTRIYPIPVRLDPVEPPITFAGLQWIDVFASDDHHKLVSTVKSLWQNMQRKTL